jgi:hypothetical protein
MSDTVCIWLVGDGKLVQGNNFKLYPNPAIDQLSVEFDEALDGKKIQIRLSNLLGEEIQPMVIQQNQSSLQLDIAKLAPGIYHLNLNGITRKFVKQSH